MDAVDLVLYSGAVYGLAWLVVKSALLEAARTRLRAAPVSRKLVDCIVCVGTWIGLALLLAMPELSTVCIPWSTPYDLVLLLGWTVFFLWIVGRCTGDAS